MFALADIQLDVLCLTVLSDDHTGVNFFTRSDEQGTTLLSTEQTVSYGLAILECDQRTLFAVLDISFIRCITVKHGIHNTITLCIGHKFATVTDQPTGRNTELQSCVTAAGNAHALQFTLSQRQLLDNGTGEFFRNIHINQLHWL